MSKKQKWQGNIVPVCNLEEAKESSGMLWMGRRWERVLLSDAERCWIQKPLGGVGFSGLYCHFRVQILYHSQICQALQTLKAAKDKTLLPNDYEGAPNKANIV